MDTPRMAPRRTPESRGTAGGSLRSRGRALVEYVGSHLDLIPWERRFLYRLARTDGDLGLSVGRGNGKSALCAAVGCAVLDGPLRIPDAEVVLVASSFQQASIMFRDVRRFLGGKLGDRSTWRVRDSQGLADIEHLPSRARLRAVGSDPRRMHGLRPVLVLADEPAQWPPTTADAALAALRTGLGKHPGSRLVALGTRPAGDHWFRRLLADSGIVYAARPGDPVTHRRTWKRANPSLDAFPHLEARLRQEVAEAKRDPQLLASFRALRLNLGESDVVEALLLEAGLWKATVGKAAALGDYVLGIDLGSTAAMSAAAGYWPDTGRLAAVACFGEVPDLGSRGLSDGVGRLYTACAERGELVTCPGRVSDVKALLGEVWERWGRPAAIVCDRWREGELRDALAALRWPPAALVTRGQGFKDGGEDVRDFRAAFAGGEVTPVESLLLASAISEARTVSDPAGNSKLSKKNEGGRRQLARDDAAAAAVLAVALGSRRSRAGATRPRGARLVAVGAA